MPNTTRCPHCETRFKVSDEQLAAHQGMVRCGSCKQAFDANLCMVGRPETIATPATEISETEAKPNEALHIESNEPQHILTLSDDLDAVNAPDSNSPPVTPFTRQTATPKKSPAWFWYSAIAILCLVWAGQAIYFYRSQLAAQLPGLKPALVAYCDVLQCEVPLLQEPDSVNLEFSDLESSRSKMHLITLKAQIRNHAQHTLAYPNLELTLSDSQDQPLARRIFTPQEYLPASSNAQHGLAADQELNLRLQLDTGEIIAAGYRLVLFYPKEGS